MVLEAVKSSMLIHLCFAISYFTSGLTINILQALMFISVKPFSKRLYRKWIYYLCYSFHCRELFINTMSDCGRNSRPLLLIRTCRYRRILERIAVKSIHQSRRFGEGWNGAQPFGYEPCLWSWLALRLDVLVWWSFGNWGWYINRC